MQDRDSDISKFSYHSYRRLKRSLGEFDAVVECNEIAIREFIAKAEHEDSNKYIQQLSSKHQIKVDEVDFIKFSARIRQYYLVSVFQQSEQFLKDFKKERKEYFDEEEWIKQEEGETKLKNIITNTGAIFSPELLNIYEYYRLVRNYMAHTDRDNKELNRRFDKTKKISNEVLSSFNLSFKPNELENIDFNDFLILTNIVKHIAFIICQNSKPNNQRIAKILFDNSNIQVSKLKKFKNNDTRYENALKSFAFTIFGRFSTVDQQEVVQELKRLLA